MPKDVLFSSIFKIWTVVYLRIGTAIIFLGLGLQFYLRFGTATGYSD